MTEIWKPVRGYKGYYEVSNLGNVKSLKSGVVMKPQTNNSGYLCLNLSLKGKQRSRLIHRLVASAFIKNPEKKKEVNHIDMDKTNNTVNNLEWVTREENLNHLHENLGNNYGSTSSDLKMRVLEVKKKLPKHGITSIFFHYFKDEYNDSVKNKSRLNNVLQCRITDEEITKKLEQLAVLLTNK